MTIFLVLGLFAGLYMLWLVVSLATYALPVSAGITSAFWLHGLGLGILASMFWGFVIGMALLVAGQTLFATTRSPLVRLGLGLLYVIPAGIAGYHAVYGLGSLAIGPGVIVSILSWIGAVVIASAAWQRLTDSPSTALSLPPNAEGSTVTTA